eukprot:89122_1
MSYFNLANLWLSISTLLGVKRPEKVKDNVEWNHTKYLDPKKGGFTRATTHNIFHGIGSMELFSNLGLYATPSFEACMRFDRFAVHHRIPGKESNFEAIFRFEHLLYTILLLLAEVRWNNKRKLCSGKKGIYKLPELYRNKILEQNEKYNALNWISKLLEYKYHPNNPRFKSQGYKTKKQIKSINKKYRHMIRLSDGFLFATSEPYDAFKKYVIKTRKWDLSDLHMESMDLMEQIVWYNGGEKYDSCVGRCITYLKEWDDEFAFVWITSIVQYKLFCKRYYETVLIFGNKIDVDMEEVTKEIKIGTLQMDTVCFNAEKLHLPVICYHGCEILSGKCVGTKHNWKMNKKVSISGFVGNGMEMFYDRTEALYHHTFTKK